MINKTDRRDIIEILLKVTLNTINQQNQPSISQKCSKGTLLDSVTNRYSTSIGSIGDLKYQCVFVCTISSYLEEVFFTTANILLSYYVFVRLQTEWFPWMEQKYLKLTMVIVA
jgi:hypothetical protein